MKKKLIITAVLAALVMLSASGAVLAQEEKAAEDSAVNAFMAKKIVGSSVFNMQGEELGTIKDIVFEVDSGRIMYAIMDFCEFLCIEGKLFPVPWSSLAALPSEGVFYLDMTGEELENAPRYNMNEMPNIGTRQWGSSVFNFYGPNERMGRRYRNYTTDYRYGMDNRMGMYQYDNRMDTFATLFDPESTREISGKIIKVGQVMPQAGIVSQMYIRLTVLTDDEKPVHVYLAPQWYIYQNGMDQPMKAGDGITATGSWVTRESSPFLIATSIQVENQTLQLREKDGTPMWRGWRRNNSNRKNN